VYGLGTYADGRPFYAMRFIQGDSLKEAIDRFHGDEALKNDPGRRSLELRRLLGRFVDVCHAIEYAHSRGVLHRDIKPGNIIVGKHGETLVVDWGLAKATGRSEPGARERTLQPTTAGGSSETLPGQVLGTPAYMSPEQARGDLESLGPQSDVYSLGATLYYLLTGKPPFVGEVGEVLRGVALGQFRPPRALGPWIDPALEAICLTAMALKPEERYSSCRALVDDIERWTADEPVSVHRDAWMTRVTRWGRRHRSAAASVGVLMASAIVGLSLGAVLINRERSKAEANFRQARAAVDEYFTTVSESKLLDVPGLQPLRKELLEAALRYYRDFLGRRGGDRSVRAEAAAASFRVAWITQALGSLHDALRHMDNAVALYEELIRADSGNAEYQRLAALAHGARGLLLLNLDRREDAMVDQRRALALRESLAAAQPNDLLIQSDVARNRRNIGDLHRQFGRPEKALEEWDKSIAIGQALLEKPLPGGGIRGDMTGRHDLPAIVREDLACVLTDRASILREFGRYNESRDDGRRARDLFEALTREQPGNQQVRTRLGTAYLDDALLQLDMGRIDESLPSFRRGLDILDGLIAANPSVPRYRTMRTDGQVRLGWALRHLGREREAVTLFENATEAAEELFKVDSGSAILRQLLSQCLTQEANLLLHMGRLAEARPKLRRAVQINEALTGALPGSPEIRSALSHALRGVGRAEAAAGARAEAYSAFKRAIEIDLSLAGQFPVNRYNLACNFALMIAVSPPDDREALALQALEALRQANGGGYGTKASVEADTDLDSLRDRRDFQNHLLDLAMPAEPFARAN
jgi:serine/threonine-protein kinase